MNDTVPTETTTNPRRWPWIVAVVAAWIVGLLIGIAGAGADTAEPVAEVDNTAAEEALDQREAELDAREDELNEWEADLTDWTEILSELTDILGTDDPDELLALIEDEEPAEAAEVSGEYTAGAYVFSDVQVGKDFTDDFEVRARVTNTGSSRELVLFKVTIFAGGSVVGTADGVVDGFDGGDTVTVSFFSLDGYVDWDEVEFQVDSEL